MWRSRSLARLESIGSHLPAVPCVNLSTQQQYSMAAINHAGICDWEVFRWMLCCRNATDIEDGTIDPAPAGAGRCGSDTRALCAVGGSAAIERENSMAVP